MPAARRVGLFVPCYVDQLYPDVGLATADLLERLGVEVEFPPAQTCCGQPMANTGCTAAAAPLARRFVEIFAGYEAVVSPSGSCVSMVRHHYDEYFGADDARAAAVRARTYELGEYLVDVLGVQKIEGRFPHRVGLHQSCHGLRELRLGPASERMDGAAAPTNKLHRLLAGLEGIKLCELERPDECCGFGGTFAVAEEAVSCMMGQDRIADHERAGAQVLTAGDMSCLMHLEGLIRRQRKPIAVMHVAQILAGRPVPAP
jgi:L-lactate dehydrogenase complex protein LldE